MSGYRHNANAILITGLQWKNDTISKYSLAKSEYPVIDDAIALESACGDVEFMVAAEFWCLPFSPLFAFDDYSTFETLLCQEFSIRCFVKSCKSSIFFWNEQDELMETFFSTARERLKNIYIRLLQGKSTVLTCEISRRTLTHSFSKRMHICSP
jgi:hypothetical protein